MDIKYRLCDLKNGQVGVICQINNIPENKLKRLYELGFVFKTKVQVLKNSKFSKIMLIGLRGYALSIDYALCQNIWVWREV